MNKADLLRDLDKWQACSKDELAYRKPEELFKPEFVGVYERLHDDIRRRMTRLHGSLFTLEQLRDLPFEYLEYYVYGPGRMEFWRLVIANFIEMTIVTLHAVVNDNEGNAHTLRSFHNAIKQAPWLHEEMQLLFKQTWRGREFDAAEKSIAARVKGIRHNWIAHRFIDKATGDPKDALSTVSLEEIRHLFAAVHSLFGALSFGASYITLAGDPMPTTIGGRPTPTCLDSVLDAVIRDSEFVKRPELQREFWPELRKHLPAEMIRVMNELRRRIGLPDA